jgi:hypothetical protein
MVRLTLERSRPGNRSITSSDVPLTNFHGFSLDMLDRSGPAKFTYTQDAATLECEGKFGWGRGAAASPSRRTRVRQRTQSPGIRHAAPGRAVPLMVISGTNLDFIREVRGAGIASSLQDVLDMAAHGVNSQYIHDVARTGYRNLRAQDYIELRDHGVEARFLEELKDAGYQIAANQVVELKDHGVDSSYVRELGAFDLHPDPSEMVALRDHGVTPEYLRGFRDAGYGKIPRR